MSTFDDHNSHDHLKNHELMESPDLSQYHKSTSAGHRKHFSIDLSLELERQLDMESQPSTPAHDADTHSPLPSHPTRESLDPHVLAHIVKQLRDSLTEVSKERDDLLTILSSTHTREAELNDALQHMTDKATSMAEELDQARRKIQDDEDAISMLRSKVEESRRGLMRLQTESRRQSTTMSVDMTRAGLPSLSSPPSAKRASFTPMTGRPNGHRRISSVSDSGIGNYAAADLFITSPTLGVASSDSASVHSLAPPSSRRISGIFGRVSPQDLDGSPPDHFNIEVEALKKEVRILKDNLEETRHELSESNEAREASETCVKALRAFIGENNIGVAEAGSSTSTKSFVIPATTSQQETDTKKANTGGTGWGFKLWKADTALKASHSATPEITPSPDKTSPAGATPPVSRKLGGFFGSRGSISSVASSPVIPQLQPSIANTSYDPQRDSLYSVSDTSSVAEPISPSSESHGVVNVNIRDVASLSDLGSSEATLDIGKAIQMEGHEARVVLG